MCRHRHNRNDGVQDTRERLADDGTRLDQRREHAGQRQAVQLGESAGQFGRPTAGRDVEKTGGGRDGHLRLLHARQVVHQQVGGEQDPFARVPGEVAGTGHKLVDRIERLNLQAGDAVQVLVAQLLRQRLGDALCAVVTVVERMLDQPLGGVEASVVDAPGVDPQGVEPSARGGDGCVQPLDDLRGDQIEVPVQVTVDGLRRVVETPGLLQGDAPVAQRAENHTTACCTEIDCCE